jgi:hypothetical protein
MEQHMEDLFSFRPITVAVVQPNPRIWELFKKDEPLTEEEWAELEFYEGQQQEEY